MTGAERDSRIRELHGTRPRSLLARWSAALLACLVVYAWLSGTFSFAELVGERSLSNLERFLGKVRPYPLWDREWDWGVAFAWIGETLAGRGGEAVTATVAMSVAAIVLAALMATLFSLMAARNVSSPEPFLPGPTRPAPGARLLWRGVLAATRIVLIFMRAIPEYIWAFLLLALLGMGAWPAVLALALHNAGILGKLGAETIENLEPGTACALRGVGATRLQLATTAIFPAALGRFLLYFFYRWETCVREATVLGLLGFVSLGWFIQDSRARMRYDDMLLFVLVGSTIILVGDLISTLARGWIRRDV